jgi:cytochrome c oxidase cbb3-type subunit 3
MRMARVPLWATLVVLVPLSVRAGAQAGAAPTKIEAARNPFSGDATAATQGAVLFRQECVFCHGVSARGGMRGPDLTTGSWTHGGSDAEIARTISEGIPGTRMPPNRLSEEEIWQIVTYLRTLQQLPAPAVGDAKRGETLFFGASRCSNCHIVNGRGGRLGPELSTVGSSRSRAYIIESIREPGRHLTEIRPIGGDATLHFDAVTVVTADGRTITGVPMNEDTFTIQLMDTTERVHSFEKRALKSLRHENRSLMPAYDSSRLNPADLDDLVAYLQTLRAGSSIRKGGSHDDH